MTEAAEAIKAHRSNIEVAIARDERERLEPCLKGEHDWQHWTEVGQFIYHDGPRPGFERCRRCDMRRESDGRLILPKWRRPAEIDWTDTGTVPALQATGEPPHE